MKKSEHDATTGTVTPIFASKEEFAGLEIFKGPNYVDDTSFTNHKKSKDIHKPL